METQHAKLKIRNQNSKVHIVKQKRVNLFDQVLQLPPIERDVMQWLYEEGIALTDVVHRLTASAYKVQDALDSMRTPSKETEFNIQLVQDIEVSALRNLRNIKRSFR